MILAVSALGLAALPAAADSPCPSGVDFNTYDASGFTCHIGNLDFSNFDYASSTPVTASEVAVDPVTGPDGPGFNFDGAWAAGAGQDLDADIKFNVTALSGSIDDIYIILGASSFTGNGSANYSENYCFGGANEPCFLAVEQPGAAQTDVVTLNSPQTSLSIDKDLELHGNSGSITVSSFGNQYSSVPEPRALSLVLGLGLLAGFAFFKRRQVAQD
jgi:hypothetical protein